MGNINAIPDFKPGQPFLPAKDLNTIRDFAARLQRNKIDPNRPGESQTIAVLQEAIAVDTEGSAKRAYWSGAGYEEYGPAFTVANIGPANAASGDQVMLSVGGHAIPFFPFSDAAGGVSSYHKLLSVTHTDTLADDVVLGDLIKGGAIKKWERLPAGTQYQLLNMDGPTGMPKWVSYITIPGTLEVDGTSTFNADVTLANGVDLLPAVSEGSAAGSGEFLFATVNASRYQARKYASSALFDFRRANGNFAAPTKLLSGNDIGLINWYGYHGGPGWAVGARIYATPREDWDAAAGIGTALYLQVADVGDAALSTYIGLDGAGETIDLRRAVDAFQNINIRDGKELRLSDVGNSHHIAQKAPALTATSTYTWPAAAVAGGHLETTAAGILSWATPFPGPTGGASGDIIYYDGEWKRLAKGSDTQILTLDYGMPAWAAPAASTAVYK